MTLPKFVSDKLIFFASYKTFPSAPVFDTFYDPARSIKYSLLVLELESWLLNWFKLNIKIIWDLDEC